jgi:ribosomal protein S18 acetylase RimI-like enzyme
MQYMLFALSVQNITKFIKVLRSPIETAKRFIAYNAMVEQINENDYYLSAIAVMPEFRSQGIGRKLLDTIEHICKKHNLKRITLDVESTNNSAKQFYKKIGFKLCSKKTNPYIDQSIEFLGYERWDKEIK